MGYLIVFYKKFRMYGALKFLFVIDFLELWSEYVIGVLTFEIFEYCFVILVIIKFFKCVRFSWENMNSLLVEYS